MDRFNLEYSSDNNTFSKFKNWFDQINGGSFSFNFCGSTDKTINELNIYVMDYAYYVASNKLRKHILTYPILGDYDFQRIKDPYTCFQDVTMYLSGVVGNEEKPIEPISDVLKAETHGFNKFSFRKDKNHKKEKIK